MASVSSATASSPARATPTPHAQLQRCFPRWAAALEHLSWQALARLAGTSRSIRTTATRGAPRRARPGGAPPPRHHAKPSAASLTLIGDPALIDGQARADRDAGLDWTTVTVPPSRLDERLRRAHAHLPIELDGPGRVRLLADQRRALAGRLGSGGDRPTTSRAGCSRTPTSSTPADLRCWRIGSAHLARARRRAARDGRPGRAAGRRCSSCRRVARRRVAADARCSRWTLIRLIV